jgi:pyruvate-ferredoxin/flavodoxin oxidoreductase
VIAIYPITSSSAMGEWADAWSAHHRQNISPVGGDGEALVLSLAGGPAPVAHRIRRSGSERE